MRTKFMALLCLLAAVLLLSAACSRTPSSAANTPPTAVLLTDPGHGAGPLAVNFSGTLSSDPGGSVVSYDWDLGDSTLSTQAEFTHTYTVEGLYSVSLTVTDNQGATATETTDITVGGDSVPTLGCHDAGASVIYLGPIDSYKNAQLATNASGCGSDPLNLYFTLVTATSEAEAFSVCAAGPDPAADTAVNLKDLGWNTMPVNVWSCNNPSSDELLPQDTCYPIGTASVQYVGPRNTFDNAHLYSADNTCSTPVVASYTYVQHSTQQAAVGVCTSIDPVFDKADTLAALFPAMPDDTYLCGTTA